MWKKLSFLSSPKAPINELDQKFDPATNSFLNKDDPNVRIFEYIDYYVQKKGAPGFAVLLKGPWGVGKSHLIGRLRRYLASKKIKCLYLSLNGKASVEELDLALWSAAVPTLDSKYSKIVGRVGQAALGLGNINLKLTASDFPKAQADLYIFDDLERCRLEIEVVLGYINQFIEHEEKKVIVVANEKEITDKEYLRKKEKLIGLSLEVKPSLKQVFDHYSDDIKDEGARSILFANFDSISEIYRRSGIPNLRILRQTIDDFERIVEALSEDHRHHAEAMKELVRLFFAFSLEYRAGRIAAGDIRARSGARWASTKEAEGRSPIVDMGERYSLDAIISVLLSDNVLIQILENGFVSRRDVFECVEASPAFAPRETEAPWRTLWLWMERTREDFDSASMKLEEQIAERNPMLPGEILHSFGIRLWMSDNKLIAKNRLEVVDEAKQYIEELCKSGKLELLSENERRDPFFSGAWQSLGFYEDNSDEFRVLRNFLVEKQRERETELYPAWASTLLEEMMKDSELFFRRLNYSSSKQEDSTYTTIPVLVGLDASEFLVKMLSLDGKDQINVCRAFDARHGSGRLDAVVPEEREWLRQVLEQIRAIVEKTDGIDRIRKERIMNWICKPIL